MCWLLGHPEIFLGGVVYGGADLDERLHKHDKRLHTVHMSCYTLDYHMIIDCMIDCRRRGFNVVVCIDKDMCLIAAYFQPRKGNYCETAKYLTLWLQ